MKVSVEPYFLPERGSHRLKAPLSPDKRLNFPLKQHGRNRPLKRRRVGHDVRTRYVYREPARSVRESGWYRELQLRP